MENPQTKIPPKVDFQAMHCSRLTGRLVPEKLAIRVVVEPIVLFLVFFAFLC